MMLDPLRDTPAEITAKLLAWGGTNEYGDPNWRIILAENHLVQRAGMWTEFDEGTEQVQFEERAHDVAYKTQQIAPTAIRIGMFWVPLYPCRGWILERWFPPSAFGNNLQWESALSQDDATPMMGPFPERGAYWMLSGGGPWPQIPLLEDVRESISIWENSTHLHGTIDEDVLARTMQRDMEEADAREEAKYDWFLSEVAYQRQTHLEFIKGNPALSGFRNRLVNDRGLMSHV
jgi:hypothetical protein